MKSGLIFISLPITEGAQGLKRILWILKNQIEISNVSSVFKRKSLGQAEFDSRIEMSVKFICESEATELKKFLRDRFDSAEVSLLAFDNDVTMTPGLTLPSPRLQSDGIVVQTSAEIWPDFFHPILKKKLIELVLRPIDSDQAEFLWQGQHLLNEMKGQS